MRKFKERVLAFCLAAASIPITLPSGAAAAERVGFVDIKGINEPFQTLTGSYSYKGNEELFYSWLISNSENGEYSDSGVTSESFYAGQQYEGKWLKFRVTCAGTEYESAPEQIDAAWGKQSVYDNDKTMFDVVQRESPSENIFKLDGESYVLLDVTENDSSKFLVMKDKTVGTRAFASSKTNMFNDMAAFLNNKSSIKTAAGNAWSENTEASATKDYSIEGYIGNSNYTQLADVILENINFNHVWRIEERRASGRPEGERVIEAGIVLPAVSDIKKYCGKIGLYDANGFWTRTPSVTSTGGAFSASAISENIGKTYESNYDSKLGIRPMFYLDKTFFADAKIPVSDMGAAVIRGIKASYKKSELSEAYTESELDTIFGYKDKLAVESISLTDEKGNRISDIKNVESFKVIIGLSNGEDNVELEVYAAVYDGKKLKSIGKCDVVMNRGASSSAVIEMKNSESSENDELRVFFWDANQTPAAEQYTHSIDFSAELCGLYDTMQKISVIINGNPYLDYSYNWYISDTEDGEYSVLSGANKADIELKSEYSEKWIRAEVSAGEVTCITAPKKIGKRWERTSNTSVAGRVSKDKDDIFSINGQEFILLDTFEYEKNKYLVMAEEPVTKRIYNTGGQKPDEIMAWLNGSEFESAGYLPASVHRHINKNTRWKVEPYAWYNNDGKNRVESYIVGGISLPALSEVKKYAEKLTIYKADSWWTRTPYAQETGGDGTCVMASIAANNGYFYPINNKTLELGIRPIFYLDKSFFANEKIDINNIGKNVRSQIINNYEKSELIAYSESEKDIITNIGNVEARLENVMDSATGTIPIKLNASTDKRHTYTFEVKADGEIINEESVTINNGEITDTIEITGLYETGIPLKVKTSLNADSIKWYISDSADGEYTMAAETSSFIPLMSMGGKYVKAEVISGGASYESAPVQLNKSWTGKTDGAPNGQEISNAQGTAKIKTISINPENVSKNTPPENVFKIDGQEFILLDTTKDENSHFLVMSKKAIGSRTITKNGQIPADIMCWLNNKKSIEVMIDGISESIEGREDYTNSGYLSGADGFTALPKKITDGIDFDAYWKQEPKMWDIVNGARTDRERVYHAGISIPAATELERYQSKFGWQDSGIKNVWSRTGSCKSGDGEQMLCYNTDWNIGTLLPSPAKTYSLGIRPIFYLKKSFFLDNVVSMDSVGSAVRDAIVSNYSAYELLNAGYNSDEVSKYCKQASGIEGNVYHMSLKGLKNGIYDMELTVKLDGETIVSDSKKVCYMPEYHREFLDFYSTKGYCDALSSDWSYDYALKSGVRMMRIGQEWNTIEKQKGVYDFSELDKRVEKFTNDGIELVLLMAFGNTLYSDTIKTGPANKEAIDAFAKCLAELAKRYPQIKHFEIYNEPNLSGFWGPSENHRDYTYLLQVCSREVKQVRSDAKVLGGALADGGKTWLLNMLSKNAYPYMEALSYHPYIYWNKNTVDSEYDNKLSVFYAGTQKYGGFKEHIITEVGWPTTPGSTHGCSNEIQALETTKQYIVAEANGIVKNMAYNFVNTGRDANENEHNFGIVTLSGEAKPAYIANAVMRNKLAGAVLCGKITFGSAGDVSHGYLYNKSGKPILVLWKDFPKGASASDISGNVNLNGESVTIYDMFGNLTASETDTVKLGSDIIYVEGLSDRWYKKAMAESYTEVIASRLSEAGLSSLNGYFSEMQSDIAGLGDELVSEDEAGKLLDKHFAIADKIFENRSSGSLVVTDAELSALLSTIYESGVFIADYYMCAAVSDYNLTAESSIEALKGKVKAKEDTEVGGYLPYANSILRIAEDNIDYAKKTAALDESNPIKNGFIKSRNALAEKLASIGSEMCGSESLAHSDIIMFAPTEEVSLKSGAQGKAVFSVYNYDDNALSGAKLIVTDASGKTLASGDVNVEAKGSIQVPLEITVSSSDLTGGYGYAYITLGGRTLVSISVKLIV